MSTHSIEQVTIVPLPDEAQPAERHLHVVEENETTSVANEVLATNQAISEGEVPTYDQLVQMGTLARSLSNKKGEYAPKVGLDLNEEQGEAFLHNADAASWELTEDETQELSAVAQAEHMRDLSVAQKAQVKALKTDVMEPEAFAFTRFREQAAKRLTLGEEIAQAKAEVAASEQAKREADVDPDEKRGFKITNADNLPSWAKLERPEDISYKDWLGMNLVDRQTAVDGTSEQTVEDATNQDQLQADTSELQDIESEEKLASEADAERPDGIPQEVWETLSDEEKDRAIAASLMEDLNAVENEPVVDESPNGLKGRLGKIMYTAQLKYLNGKSRVAEYFTDEEKGKRRRVVAGVAGAVAVLGAVYLQTKGMRSGASSGEAANALPLEDQLAAVPAEVIPTPEVAVLPKGGTVWGLAEQNLGGRPTNAQILAETQRLLDLNHISWEEARKLATGTKITL